MIQLMIKVNFNQNINLYANLGVNSKTITPTQLSYLSNVTSDIQTQINNITAGSLTFNNLTINNLSCTNNATIQNLVVNSNIILGSTGTPYVSGYLTDSGFNCNLNAGGSVYSHIMNSGFYMIFIDVVTLPYLYLTVFYFQASSNPSVLIISNPTNANITASKTVGGNPKFNISFNLGPLYTQFSYTFNKLYYCLLYTSDAADE